MVKFDPYSTPGLLIRRLHQISLRTFASGAAPLELNTVQYGTLMAITANPGTDQTSLAELVDIDRTTVVKVLDRLVARGLITREVDPKDRRSRLLFPTDQGKDFIKEFDHLAVETQETLLGPLSDEERKSLMAMLRRLVEAHAEQKAAK